MKISMEQVDFETSIGNLKQLQEEDLPEVVFSGRSNVGKSSLLNRLMGRRRLAKVSATPGKTATINFYRLGDLFRLVDLPGYGYAKVPKTEKERWRTLIRGYLTSGRPIALVVQLVDVRHAPSQMDLQMIDFLADARLPCAIAFTKCDKLSFRQLEERKKDFEKEIFEKFQLESVYTSSETGAGMDILRSWIGEVCGLREAK